MASRCRCGAGVASRRPTAPLRASKAQARVPVSSRAFGTPSRFTMTHREGFGA